MPYREFVATANTDPVTFRIGADMFEASAQCPAGILLRLAAAAGAEDGSAVTSTVDFINSVLLPASKERFNERLESIADPIAMQQLTDVLTWLMEVYTGRPTDTPSPSPAGPSVPSESSTVTSSPVEASTS